MRREGPPSTHSDDAFLQHSRVAARLAARRANGAHDVALDRAAQKPPCARNERRNEIARPLQHTIVAEHAKMVPDGIGSVSMSWSTGIIALTVVNVSRRIKMTFVSTNIIRAQRFRHGHWACSSRALNGAR